ncbi:MAG: N-acetylneuraminate synthase [Spirosomataceae bacterium]
MKPIIIAEAGVNHNGLLENALQLVDVAADAGADYVKFQTFQADLLVTSQAPTAEYQQKNTGEENQADMLRQLELSWEDHLAIQARCQQKGIQFLSTAFDLMSIDWLLKLGITLGKIPSGELTNFPYLRKMAQSFPNLILSTGMATLQEVKEALAVLYRFGHSPETVTVLHCTTQYPTPLEEVNLHVLRTFQFELGTSIGYSDHTLGIEVSLAAVALGATVIEKHFTLSREMPGPDHQASLEPAELHAMVEGIRKISLALGSYEKSPTPSEQKNKPIARKSLVAARFIPAGTRLSEEDLTVKRPGHGISPMQWENIVGIKTDRDFQPDDLLVWPEK